MQPLPCTVPAVPTRAGAEARRARQLQQGEGGLGADEGAPPPPEPLAKPPFFGKQLSSIQEGHEGGGSKDTSIDEGRPKVRVRACVLVRTCM